MPREAQSAHSKRIFANTLRGTDAWTRHREYVVRYLNVYERDGGKAREEALRSRGRTDFDVLRERHRFIRNDAERTDNLNYEDAVAAKYYSSLFKEYALADLKHYKTGAIALRWRSEDELISGIGQFTCANTRCTHHRPTTAQTPGESFDEHLQSELTSYELNFAYVEPADEDDAISAAGPSSRPREPTMVRKNALVKVVLCRKCAKKLRYKREKEKRAAEEERRDLRAAEEGIRSADESDEGEDDEVEQVERKVRAGATGDKRPAQHFEDRSERSSKHRRERERSRSPDRTNKRSRLHAAEEEAGEAEHLRNAFKRGHGRGTSSSDRSSHLSQRGKHEREYRPEDDWTPEFPIAGASASGVKDESGDEDESLQEAGLLSANTNNDDADKDEAETSLENEARAQLDAILSSVLDLGFTQPSSAPVSGESPASASASAVSQSQLRTQSQALDKATKERLRKAAQKARRSTQLAASDKLQTLLARFNGGAFGAGPGGDETVDGGVRFRLWAGKGCEVEGEAREEGEAGGEAEAAKTQEGEEAGLVLVKLRVGEDKWESVTRPHEDHAEQATLRAKRAKVAAVDGAWVVRQGSVVYARERTNFKRSSYLAAPAHSPTPSTKSQPARSTRTKPPSPTADPPLSPPSPSQPASLVLLSLSLSLSFPPSDPRPPLRSRAGQQLQQQPSRNTNRPSKKGELQSDGYAKERLNPTPALHIARIQLAFRPRPRPRLAKTGLTASGTGTGMSATGTGTDSRTKSKTRRGRRACSRRRTRKGMDRERISAAGAGGRNLRKGKRG